MKEAQRQFFVACVKVSRQISAGHLKTHPGPMRFFGYGNVGWPDYNPGEDPYIRSHLFSALFPHAPELKTRGIHISASLCDRFIPGWRKHSARTTLPDDSYGLTILPSIVKEIS